MNLFELLTSLGMDPFEMRHNCIAGGRVPCETLGAAAQLPFRVQNHNHNHNEFSRLRIWLNGIWNP